MQPRKLIQATDAWRLTAGAFKPRRRRAKATPERVRACLRAAMRLYGLQRFKLFWGAPAAVLSPAAQHYLPVGFGCCTPACPALQSDQRSVLSMQQPAARDLDLCWQRLRCCSP